MYKVLCCLTFLQSLAVVDGPELRDLLRYVGQDLRDCDIPHRDKLTDLVLKRFKTERENMIEDMQVGTVFLQPGL